jgi:arylsulfatase A-like enzyme
MRKLILRLILLGAVLYDCNAFSAGKAEHVVVVVWDGMRPDFISKEHTPTLYQLAQDGVMFQNHHAVYPSSTEVNGAAIATGAYPQNNGIIANREYRPAINLLQPIDTQNSDAVRKGDEISHGHYLLCPTIAEILQAAGLKTAIAGTKPVVLLHDRRERPEDYRAGVLVFEGKAIPPSLQTTLNGLLGKFPAAEDSKSLLPNEQRDEWTTRALIGPLWSNGVPAFSLLWLSEPDFSQHPSSPGAPKALAALESCDRKLAEVFTELERRKLRDKTDVFVVSDHGFSTIERGVDICAELQKAGFQAQRNFTNPPQPGQILIDGLGSLVFLYVVGHDSNIVDKLVEFLQKQDFTGVIFTRKKVPGAFTLDEGKLDSPEAPDVVLSFHWSAAKSKLGVPGLLTVDGTSSSQGGAHGSLGQYDLHNILVGGGPDLKQGYADSLPTGNTDLAPTILWLLGEKTKEPMDGRVLSEALVVEAPKVSEPVTRRIEAKRTLEHSTWSQYLEISSVNGTIYFNQGDGGTQAK